MRERKSNSFYGHLQKTIANIIHDDKILNAFRLRFETGRMSIISIVLECLTSAIKQDKDTKEGMQFAKK